MCLSTELQPQLPKGDLSLRVTRLQAVDELVPDYPGHCLNWDLSELWRYCLSGSPLLISLFGEYLHLKQPRLKGTGAGDKSYQAGFLIVFVTPRTTAARKVYGFTPRRGATGV